MYRERFTYIKTYINFLLFQIPYYKSIIIFNQIFFFDFIYFFKKFFYTHIKTLEFLQFDVLRILL